MSSAGAYTPPVQLSNENGKVVVFLDDRPYFGRFTVRANGGGIGENAAWFNGWTVVDEALSGSGTVTVTAENAVGTLRFANPTAGGPDSLILPSSGSASGQLSFRPGGNLGPVFSPNGGIAVGATAVNPPGNGALFSGTVGIGTVAPCASLTSPPNCKLAVNGAIEAKEVVVDTGWSDYVFDPAYKLATLSEVSEFVGRNHHLPRILTAKEAMRTGVNLGAMRAQLLAKIEELTLHLIEGDRRMRELERTARDAEAKLVKVQQELEKLRSSVSGMGSLVKSGGR